MHILIISYYCYPEPTPRGYRCFEFLKEFIRKGYKVTLVLPKKRTFESTGFKTVKDLPNLEVVLLGNEYFREFVSKKEVNVSKNHNPIRNFALKIYKYFFPETHYLTRYRMLIADFLKAYNKKTECIVSIGLPINVHWGVASGLEKNALLREAVKFADYGDPFSTATNRSLKRYIGKERQLLKMFDYLIVPSSKSIDSFTPIFDRKKIIVVNHCINFDDIPLSNTEYETNNIVTFAFSGIMYKDMRNPEPIVAFLSKLKHIDFIFRIYTISSHRECNDVVDEIKNKLGDKVVVNYDLERYALINELKKVDFLLNLQSATGHLLTSKLVDYCAAGRPILQYDLSANDTKILEDFLLKDFSKALILKKENYDIKVQLNNLTDLIKTK